MSAGRAAAVEAELKLAAAPRTIARLAGEPLLGSAEGAAQPLTAIYFDTPRRSLWRNGYTLRLRRERGRWVQTVKGRGTLEAGLHRRLEDSQDAERPEPSLDRIGDDELRKQVAGIVREAPLKPVFQVEVTREVRLASPQPDVLIEASLDRGTIRAGNARAQISEIELELKQGAPWHVFDLALAVSERYTARLEHRSKAERGYALAGAIRPAPVRSRFAVSGRGVSVSAALKEICIACLNHLQANQPGVMRGGEPEYLHQARVALRRMHAGLLVFKRMAAREALEPQIDAVRKFLRSLGPARDWDVYAGSTLAPVLRQFEGHKGLAALARATERLREEANGSARRLFASRRYQRLVLGLGRWLAREPWLEDASARQEGAWQADVREHAVLVLERYHRRVRKTGRDLESAGLKRLHRLRIATKKLRYAAIFFAPLFVRGSAREMLSALNDLQDLLGAINDCAAASALLDESVRAARGPMRTEARTIVNHWNSSQLEERRRELPEAWEAFRSAARFWR